MTAATTPEAIETPHAEPHVHEVIVIGTGFAGLGLGIKLRERGTTDFLLLERGTSVGGTWRDNHYPGAACDVPSHLYSLSFEPKPDWSSGYSGHAEIRDYLENCATSHDLHRHIRFDTEVCDATWDEDLARWTVTSTDGRTFTSRALVMGIGFLRDPATARLPGIDDFTGPQMHSARWDHDVDLTGRRVAVIGTGASAIQFVPEIAPVAAHTTVFQRTAPWVIPKTDRRYLAVEKWAFRWIPGARRLKRATIYAGMEATYFLFFRNRTPLTAIGERLMRTVIRRSMTDTEKMAKVMPDITLGCKRVLKSNDWYPTLDREDVAVETRAIARITPTGAELADGTEVAFDVLVHGTGFAVDDVLGNLEVNGRGGASLREVWGRRPTAYLGIEVPDFPNAFILHGPNTGLGHNSMIFMLESGMTWILEALAHLDQGARTVEVRRDVHDEFVAEVDARNAGTIWASGCQSWYLNEAGENFTIWPGSTLEYRRRTGHFDVAAHLIEPGTQSQPTLTAKQDGPSQAMAG